MSMDSMSAWRCRIELVVVRLAEDRPYLYGLEYNKPSEKTIHFAHEIDDFGKITDAEAWRHITHCIAVMNLSTEKCLEIVKVSHGIRAGVSRICRNPTGLTVPTEWNKSFVRQINAGDSIEIRFRGPILPKDRPTYRFEVRQVHVNLNEGEEYGVGSATHGIGMDYDNRITCEFTQYVYVPKEWTVLQTDFVTKTDKFPLVQSVARDECMEVAVKRYSKTGQSVPQTIWQQGNALQLAQPLIIYSGDVIEIRLLKRNKPHEKSDEDKGDNTDESEMGDEPDEDESSDDESKRECTICMDGIRDVVLKPCGHCCVCRGCSDNILAKAERDKEKARQSGEKQEDALCPFCRGIIQDVVNVSEWRGRPIIYVTAGMDDLHGLLASLQRHCV